MDGLGNMTTSEVTRASGATRARLRSWEARGLIQPERVEHGSRTWRVYAPDQVERIKEVMALLAEGYSLGGAARRLERGATTTMGSQATGGQP
jgi:DNA-binding transcriptional MerR regulator